MITIWFQNMVQDGNNPEPSDMFHKKDFNEPKEALEWISRMGDQIKVERITGDDLELEVRTKRKPTYARKKPSMRMKRKPQPPIDEDEDDDDF